jgi:hypothetical protein
MKEDKNLQSLFKHYGIQETSGDFDNKLMQKIALLDLYKTSSKSLINPVLVRVFVIASFVVAVTVLAFTFSVEPGIISKYFFTSLPGKIYVQLFSFLAAFWIVMFLNMWWNKKRNMNFV